MADQEKTSIEAFLFMRGLMDECTHLGTTSRLAISLVFLTVHEKVEVINQFIDRDRILLRILV
jgi:hypothetical protein